MNSAVELFTSELVRLPKSRTSSDRDFVAYLREVLDEFDAAVGRLRANDPLTQAVLSERACMRAAANHLVDAVRESHSGRQVAAHAHVDEAMAQLRPAIDRLASKETSLTAAFRMRLRPPNRTVLSKGDTFHISTKSRHLVRRQRFSLPGVPSLYLGASIYTCWVEFSEPPFHKIHATRLVSAPDERIQIVDLGLPDDFVAPLARKADPKDQKELLEFVTAHAVSWPLRFCCLIRRYHGDSPHVDEYIVPQMVLRWVAENDEWDGIRYPSTHIEWPPTIPALGCNFVFPARSPDADGFCAHLRSKFHMTDPISWERAMCTNFGEVHVQQASAEIEVAPGVRVLYRTSDFGIFESRLGALRPGPL